MARALPRLLAVTDDNVAPDHLRRVWPLVARALPAGGVALSVRYRGLGARDLCGLCAALKAATPGAPVLVSRRLDVCVAAGLDGVHLPAHGVGPARAREVVGPGALIVQAAHDREELAEAAHGADLALLSPLWAPGSHLSDRPAWGVDGLQALLPGAGVPVLAMGGVTPENVGEAAAAGAWGVAVVSALWRAPDPARGAQALFAAWPRQPEEAGP
jgi:thiamine-phosphate pyrophosphorylase